MQLPEGLLSKTEAALAFFAGALAVAGLVFTLVLYVSLYSFIQAADAAVSPQIDVAIASVSDAQQVASFTADSADSAVGSLSNFSSALFSYSNASGSLGDSISGIAAVPPFSLDPRVASSAASMRQASAYFADAGKSLNASASSAVNASVSIRKAGSDLSLASSSLEAARSSFKGAIGALHLAAMAVCLALLCLFSSVILLSLSIMLSNYPKLFSGEGGAQKTQKK
ncbi:Uncharacterised protein [uncultured archaeon]|nr:Uncharacterised protein [uncultured archaeon]